MLHFWISMFPKCPPPICSMTPMSNEPPPPDPRTPFHRFGKSESVFWMDRKKEPCLTDRHLFVQYPVSNDPSPSGWRTGLVWELNKNREFDYFVKMWMMIQNIHNVAKRRENPEERKVLSAFSSRNVSTPNFNFSANFPATFLKASNIKLLLVRTPGGWVLWAGPAIHLTPL